MKVLQLLPTLAMGDAIGNDVRALDKVIRGMGYQTGIYAEVIDGRLHSRWRKCLAFPART